MEMFNLKIEKIKYAKIIRQLEIKNGTKFGRLCTYYNLKN